MRQSKTDAQQNMVATWRAAGVPPARQARLLAQLAALALPRAAAPATTQQ